MEREQRNALRRIVERARRLLEKDASDQLEGSFGILPSGKVLDDAPGDQVVRDRLLSVLHHHRAGGASAKEAVARLSRESAFTTLNRFVALMMAERRGIVPEVISKGLESTALRELGELAPGLRAACPDGGLRLLIESVMDELSLGLKVLMDRRSPIGLIWPTPHTLDDLLELLNDPELGDSWTSDEAIGWVFQYFNADDAAEMRDKAAAPRNSRELAVRNQFFTPQYVVEFLTDNTLGRIWLEMRRGDSVLRERCQMLAVGPDEDLAVTNRQPRDPRDLKVLDPAVGSGHFLLYVYDLFEHIYIETWQDPSWPAWVTTGTTLRDDYPTEDELRRAIPGLILGHNLYGVEIDPRAAQNAAMALWLRAQRAYNEMGLATDERPAITRAHIVIAEPLPGDSELLEQLLEGIDQPRLQDLVRAVWSSMELASEAGSLLRADEEIEQIVAAARDEMAPLLQQIDPDLWAQLEEHLQRSVEWAASIATAEGSTAEQLFAEDVGHGLAYIALCRERFDVVLMNPPFGAATESTEEYISSNYPYFSKNLLCAFIARVSEILKNSGLCGSVIDRTILIKNSYEGFRRKFFLEDGALKLVADLGWGVLDANVEVSTVVFSKGHANNASALGVDVSRFDNKAVALRNQLSAPSIVPLSTLEGQPFATINLQMPAYLTTALSEHQNFLDSGFQFVNGHTIKSDVFKRLFWEVGSEDFEAKTDRLWNGSSYSPFFVSLQECVLTKGLSSHRSTIFRNTQKHKLPGICYGKRGDYLDAQILPAGFVLTNEGFAAAAAAEENTYLALAVLNALPTQVAVNSYCGQHKGVGYVNILPLVGAGSGIQPRMAETAKLAYDLCRACAQASETDPLFLTPFLRSESGLALRSDDWHFEYWSASERVCECVAKTDELCAIAFGIDQAELALIRESATNRPRVSALCFLDHRVEKQVKEFWAKSVLSYLVGCEFGRWDIRLCADEGLAPQVPDPFEKLPVCPPGMLQDELDEGPSIRKPGLPSGANNKRSPGGFVFDRILVDDPRNASDIVARVGRSLGLLFGQDATDVEREICQLLGFEDFRAFFRKPLGFFAEHLGRYSKGNRKAPIYWPLSTSSCRYTAWLYYPRLSTDTLDAAVNDHVMPKIALVEQRLAQLEARHTGAQGRDASRLNREISELTELRDELEEMRQELARVARLPYRPNLDDGVDLTAAPLWRLFRHTPWRRHLEKRWKELEQGKYDWSHIAMAIWPDRVKAKCKTDLFLAIAHDLEELYQGASASGDREGTRRRG